MKNLKGRLDRASSRGDERALGDEEPSGTHRAGAQLYCNPYVVKQIGLQTRLDSFSSSTLWLLDLVIKCPKPAPNAEISQFSSQQSAVVCSK